MRCADFAKGLVVGLLCLAIAGCSIWPKSWRWGGTPAQREATAAGKEQQAREAEIGAAQRAVHQTAAAIEAAQAETPDSKPLTVARDFNLEAQALLDQAHGAPGAADVQAWRKLVADVLAGRDKEREAQRAEVANLSTRLTKSQAAHARALEEVKGEAAENTFWSDLAHKLMWAVIAFVLFVIATHLIGLAAHLNPASALLGGLATTMHTTLASGAVLAARQAQDGLMRVGGALALVRQKLPSVATEVTSYFDAATASHAQAQKQIAAGATAAGSPPA